MHGCATVLARPGPAAVPRVRHGAAQLWFVPTPADPALLARMARVLGPDEAARAARFRREADRAGFVALHATARHLLGEVVGRAPGGLTFRQPPGHKPVLEDAPGLEFSLSHTHGLGLVGIAAARIGVDVEAMRPVPDADAIARRFFAPEEAEALATLPDQERLDGFFACWTRKEAYVKAIGLGLSTPLDRFVVDLRPGRPALLAVGGEAAAGWSMWATRTGAGGAPPVWAAAAAERPGMVFEAAWADLSGWEA